MNVNRGFLRLVSSVPMGHSLGYEQALAGFTWAVLVNEHI